MELSLLPPSKATAGQSPTPRSALRRLQLREGAGAAGACIVTKAIDSWVEVIGVQAEKAPAAYVSWRKGELAEAKMQTFAEGLATRRTVFKLPQSILRDLLDAFVLVSEY